MIAARTTAIVDHRGMQFGVFDHIDDDGRPVAGQLAQRLALAELYDRLGFRSYHLAEHHGTPLAHAPAPNVFLSALAARTKRLRFGPLVYVLPLYDPLRLAEEIATLDQLSGGRLELGVGRGASPLESALFGADTDREQFLEALEVIRAALTSDRLTHHGRFYDYEDVPIEVRPWQRPHPPLWFGIGRPDAAVWAAANDVNACALLPAPLVRTITDRYRAEWEALGKPADELPLLGLNRPLVLAEDEGEAIRIASRAYKRWKRNLDWLWDERGVVSPLAGVLSDEFEGFMGIGGAFAGTPAQAREFVHEQLETAGATYLAIDPAFGDVTYEETVRTVELFAREIMAAT
jgi:alkanesulfonate monooxygenase SsuD/methylene tetrahydromethanopterin reductase-like flavin-dependent oxidoreductase (luciferase family)